MNNLKTVHPVAVTSRHEQVVPTLFKTWSDTRVIMLNSWERGRLPGNVTICNLLELSKVAGYRSRIPYGDGEFGACICQDTLDKMPDPTSIVKEIERLLVPGGYLYLEVPFLQPYDHTNPSYYRFTPAGIRYLLNRFEIVRLDIFNGPGSTMHWISRIYHALRFDREGNLTTLHERIGDPNYLEAESIFGMTFSHLKDEDEELGRKEHAISIACSYSVLARKQGGKEDNDELDAEHELRAAPKPD